MIKYSSIGESVTKVMRYKSTYLWQTEEITYPDGERVEYSYNEAGHVDGIKGNFEYVKNIGYNKHSQRNCIEYGNGVVSDYTYNNTRRWLTELKTKNGGGAATPITVAGTVVLGGVGIYSLMDGITKVATSLADQEFKGGMPILTEQIAKDCGASNDTAEMISNATSWVVDGIGMAISPSTATLQQALKTDTAVKTFKAVNTVINLSVIGTDII